jgi:hypothetical protein
VGNSWTRIAVPLIGLLTAGAALALVAFAPGVLFLDDGSAIGPSASAPPASSEVAQVTAPPVRVRPAVGRAGTAGATEPTPSNSGSAAATGSPSGSVASGTADKTRSVLGRTGGTNGEEPSLVEKPGKAKGHGKAKHHGKAKGHAKHGKAKGHTKRHHAGRVAFTQSCGAKPGHVHHPRAQRHAGGRARAHARPRR